MSESPTNTLLTVLGGGALAWLLFDNFQSRKEAREAADGGGFAEEMPPVWPATAPAVPPSGRPPGRSDLARRAPRTFDPIFAMHGNGIPVAYLRALALHESDMNPRAKNRSSSATGLLQVIEVVRKDFNTKHGTAYEPQDLLDPAINVTIASSVIARIAAAYERYHPEVANLRTDWANPRFVELLTFGWNAGFSERAGVGLVVSTLVARRQREITIDDVHRAARAAGAVKHLSDPARARWAKVVTAQYMRERTRDEVEGYAVARVASAPAPAAAEPGPVSSPSQVDATLEGEA